MRKDTAQHIMKVGVRPVLPPYMQGQNAGNTGSHRQQRKDMHAKCAQARHNKCRDMQRKHVANVISLVG